MIFGSGSDETRQIAVEDMNGDGMLDIVAANIGEKNRIFFNSKVDQFQESLTFGNPNDKTMTIAVGDLDQDGDMDIVTGINGKKNQLFINTLGKYPSTRFSSNRITYGITLSDVNGNGRLDII